MCVAVVFICHMPRASAAQRAQRLNRSRILLQRCSSLPQAVQRLAKACSLSSRQAYRYLKQAQRLKHPVPGLYRQTTIHTDPPTPRLCRSHSAHVERHRQSRVNCDARSRPEAWLTSGQPVGRARFISNISSIAYWIPSSLKPTKSWSLTSGGPHAILRR